MIAEHELIAMVTEYVVLLERNDDIQGGEEQRTEFHCGKWKHFYKRSH